MLNIFLNFGSEKGKKATVSEKCYLFILQDDSHYVKCAINFKNAVQELAIYYGEASEMFLKCMNGYSEDDIKGIVELYNHFAYTPVVKAYVIENMLYSE